MGRPRMFDGLSDRSLVVPALVLAFAIVWAWTAVLAGGPMGGSVAAFLVAWVAMMAAMMLPSAAPMVLLYQFTPLKGACLRACRTPADFLMQHWRGGTGGALRLGFHHGAYCLGCCWAL